MFKTLWNLLYTIVTCNASNLVKNCNKRQFIATQYVNVTALIR